MPSFYQQLAPSQTHDKYIARDQNIITKLLPLKAFSLIFSSTLPVSPPLPLSFAQKAFCISTYTHTHFYFPLTLSHTGGMYDCAFAFRICNSIFFTKLTSNQRKFSLFSLFSANTYKRPKRHLCYQKQINECVCYICFGEIKTKRKKIMIII